MERGVYFVANDKMMEFAIAFLNSFRMYNPTLPMCLVPFDDESNALIALKDEYSFTVWTDFEALSRADLVSVQFHGGVVGQYRKLVIWEGPYDQFIYIDVDTIVLSDLSFVFSFLSSFEFITSHSNIAHIRKWVWKDSIYDSGTLAPRQIAFSANTGFIVSKRGCLSLNEACSALPDALALVPHMELLCYEQPFLNYLIVTSGHRYSSFFVIRRLGNLSQIPVERWAGKPLGKVENGKIVEPVEPRTMLVHWAGEWRKLYDGKLPNSDLWNFYRYL